MELAAVTPSLWRQGSRWSRWRKAFAEPERFDRVKQVMAAVPYRHEAEVVLDTMQQHA